MPGLQGAVLCLGSISILLIRSSLASAQVVLVRLVACDRPCRAVQVCHTLHCKVTRLACAGERAAAGCSQPTFKWSCASSRVSRHSNERSARRRTCSPGRRQPLAVGRAAGVVDSLLWGRQRRRGSGGGRCAPLDARGLSSLSAYKKEFLRRLPAKPVFPFPCRHSDGTGASAQDAAGQGAAIRARAVAQCRRLPVCAAAAAGGVDYDDPVPGEKIGRAS